MGEKICPEVLRTNKILVVDDDERVVRTTVKQLSKAGFKVLSTTHGSECIHLCLKHRPSLVLLDVDMPDADGREVCRAIKLDERLQDTFVILVSGVHTNAASRVVGLESLADDYLTRPINEKELVTRLYLALRLRNALVAARQSERRYRGLFETVCDAVIVFDAGSRQFLDVNQAALDLYGYTREEFLGLTLRDVTAEPEKTDQSVLEVVSAPAGIRIPLRYHRRKDGRAFPAEISEGQFDLEGRPAVCAVVRDITERRQAEERLRESETRYREIVEAAQEGIWVIDEKAKTRFVNHRMAEMLGYTEAEMQGAPLKSFMDEQGWAVAVRKLEDRQQGVKETHEFRFRRKDGTDLYALVATNPLRGKGGEYAGALAMVADITDRKEMEQALARSERDKGLILDATSDSIVYFDADLRIQWANRAAVEFGGAGPDVVGRRCCEVWYDRTEPCEGCPMVAAREAKQPREAEVTMPSGSVWLLRGYPILGEDGSVIALAEFGRNITEQKRAEEELRRSRALLAETERIAQVGGWNWDLASQEITFTDEWMRIHGVTERSLSLEELMNIAHPDDLDAISAAWERTRETGEPYDIQHRIIRQDTGQIRWVQAHGEAQRDAAGRPARALGVAMDITERKKAADDLQRGEERFHRAMEATRDGLFDWDLVTDDIYYSPGWKGMLGYAYDELPNDFAAWEKLTDPEDVKRAWEMQQELVAGLRERFEMEFRMRHKEGHWVDILSRATAVRDGSGEAVRIVGTHVDITERKRIEQEFRRERDRAQRYLDIAGVILIALNDREEVAMINRKGCELLGKSSDEIVGKNWFDNFIPARLRKGIKEAFTRLMAGDESVEYHENPILTPDGQERIIAWHNTVLTDPEGRVTGTLSSGEDVTAQSQLQEQLRQSQKMEAVGQLAGGVAHDFRNQLQVIHGFASMLLRRNLVAEKGMENLKEILTAAERSSRLTDQLLAFSRRKTLHPVRIDPRDAVHDLQKTLPWLLGEDIRVRVDLRDEPLCVELDPGQYHQALINLCLNARDAMPEGGELLIEVGSVERDEGKCEGRCAVISVRDTGIGMDDTTRLRAFDPFFTTKEVGKGTGLGLAMVYGFVKQSHGAITCESEPGEGSTFRMYFPTVDGPLAKAQEAPAAETLARGSGRVLLVEDEVAVERLLAEVLDEAGYEVLHVTDPRKALEVLHSEAGAVDVLIADVVMPGMSGVDLADQAVRLRPDVKILYMSGYAKEDPSRRRLDESRAGVLAKPFRPGQLLDKLAELLDRRPQ